VTIVREVSNAESVVDARTRWTPTTVAVTIWFALIAVAAVVGALLLWAGVHMQIGAPPLTGHVGWRFTPGLVPAVAVGGAGIIGLPAAARRMAWTPLLLTTAAATAAWAIALNLVDGWHALVAPVHTEYAATAARIVSPAHFLSTFTTDVRRYNLHTQGHPPAMELILWCVDRVGWRGPGAAAALYIAVGSCAGAAALVALRDVAGEERARAAVPFVVLVPAVIWLATSGDAFFAGVSAWAVALLVLASGARGRRSVGYAVAGGLLLGLTAFLSYGLVLLALIPTVVAVRRGRARPLVVAAGACAAVFVGFSVARFSWIAGLHVTQQRYAAGVAGRRPYAYFVVADLAVLALAVGPAAAIGLAWLRDRAAWLLVGSALVVVMLVDASGLSKAEVERIWLPFVPWVVLAAAAGATHAADRPVRRVRLLLAAQVATAIAIQVTVRSPW
jgi:hypothetical protein